MPNKGVKWRCAMWKMSDGKPAIEFCRETGAKYQTIWQYINIKEMSVDDACALAIKNKGKKDVNSKLFFGNTTLRSYCQKTGISYGNVYLRIKKGLSIEDAIASVKAKQKK